MRLLTNPNMSISAQNSQVSPRAPIPATQSLNLAATRKLAGQPVDPMLAAALAHRNDPKLLPDPTVPMTRVNQSDAAPTFDEMLQQLGAPAPGMAGAPTPRPSWDRPVDPRIVQTMLGEAANQGEMGLAGVAQVIMNRSQKDPDNIMDPVDVALERRGNSPYHQFSTWNSGANQGNNPQKYQPGSPEYEAAEKIWRDVRDNAYDFTGGATHYINPAIADPEWADPNVEGTENLYGGIQIEDHLFFPRTPVEDRPSIASNPSLATTIAAGGIGPNVQVASNESAPVPFNRPVGLAAAANTRVNYGPGGVGIMPSLAGLENFQNGNYTNIAAGARGNVPAEIAVADVADPIYNSPFVPEWLTPGGAPNKTPVTFGGKYGVSDMVRAAQSNTERLPPNVGFPAGTSAEVWQGPTLASIGGGPRPRPPTVSEATMGGGEGPIDGTPLLAGMVPGAQPIGTQAPSREPTVWDNVVDMSGSMLSHTGLGGLVSSMFPDTWYGAGETFKGNGLPGSSARLADQGNGRDAWGSEIGQSIYSMTGGGTSAGADSGAGYADRGGGAVFIDANGNGIDDRSEPGYVPPGTVIPPVVATPAWTPRKVNFPALPPYRPGIDGEWSYFTGEGYAEGGLVDALPQEAPASASPFDGMDPRVSIIAAAEDALEGDSADPEAAIKAFVDAFGEEALQQLAAQVKAGMSLKKGQPRMIEGPGGPTDDAVPALIDGVQPAALSSGEVVIPADAVMGAGDGDPREGADRLMALSEQLSQKAG